MASSNSFCSRTIFFPVPLEHKREREKDFHTDKHILVMHLNTVHLGRSNSEINFSGAHIKIQSIERPFLSSSSPVCLDYHLLPRLVPINSLLLQKKGGREGGKMQSICTL